RERTQGGGRGPPPVLLRRCLRETRFAAPRTPATRCRVVCLAVKPVGEPDSGNRDLRFDERGWETGCWPLAPSYRAHPRLYHSVYTFSAAIRDRNRGSSGHTD